ncbi:MAG TPA: GIY-YIG nuclease family protein [Planctomycetota bacterium]|jgi:excinuclease ABC subunit C
MPVPDYLKADFEALPDAPGVYIYKDAQDREIYVGKALSLRKRVRQYFDEKRPFDQKTADLVARIHAIEFCECQSEVEAFLLENRLIKDLQPIFNIHAKSDINFPVVEVTDEDFPRVNITRDRTNKRSKYYGPFISASWLRVALQVLQRVFKYRTCNLDIKESDPRNRFFRPCLEYHIGRCKAPCAALQTSEDYKASMKRLAMFLQGRAGDVEKELERDMKKAAQERRYEDAAGLRDTLTAIRSLRDRGSIDDEMEPGVLHIDPKDGVAQLQEALHLQTPPRCIEGIDIAHLHGQETVGALVSFVDGLPSREQYRRFRIKTVSGVDDFASIREIVTRRYDRLLREGSPLPDLILIDGGLGQLHAAQDALRTIGLETARGGEEEKGRRGETADAETRRRGDAENQNRDREGAAERQEARGSKQEAVQDAAAAGQEPRAKSQELPYLASLAKQEEILFTLDHPEGLRLPRRSPALRMLQYVRDEAHRFSRHYHHILRRKRVLDEE